MFDRRRVPSGSQARRRHAYQSPPPRDPLRERLKQSKWDLICPHRKDRKRAPTQDGRKLRRYRRRWTIERTFAWPGNFRRLLVRHEFYVTMHDAFMHIACAMIRIRRF